VQWSILNYSSRQDIGVNDRFNSARHRAEPADYHRPLCDNEFAVVNPHFVPAVDGRLWFGIERPAVFLYLGIPFSLFFVFSFI